MLQFTIEGISHQGATPGGKPCGSALVGLQGTNDYTLYALSVDTLNLSGEFDGASAEQSLADYVIERTEVLGTYAIYDKARL